nr:MAG TPA: hypothetical protein [Caudoviricetes sp.]
MIPFACVPKASNHKPLCPLWNNDKVETINTCSTLSLGNMMKILVHYSRLHLACPARYNEYFCPESLMLNA